ncbi:MAG: hypothetical protein Q8L64_06835 [bacterium]|nr:hypothetical protein [bacterium]
MSSFSWQTHEYAHRERSQDWFWVVGIIAGAVAITAVLFGNILFAVLVVIGAFVLCLFAARRPGVVTVEIAEKFVRVENVVYPFKELKSYWIDPEHFDGARLILEQKRIFMPHVMIPMDIADMEHVKAIMDPRLPMVEFKENPFQEFIERLGF